MFFLEDPRLVAAVELEKCMSRIGVFCIVVCKFVHG